MSPEGFERIVLSELEKMKDSLRDFTVKHRPKLAGADGEFEIDAVAQFEALGAEFIVLVECKHHKSRVKREDIQVLHDKLRSLNAHKGMVFSTGGFQKGAVKYAMAHHIALIHCTEGGPIFETKDRYGPRGPCRPYEAYFVLLDAKGEPIYQFGCYEELTHYMFGENAN